MLQLRRCMGCHRGGGAPLPEAPPAAAAAAPSAARAAAVAPAPRPPPSRGHGCGFARKSRCAVAHWKVART